jgi:ubiquinone/menaquinone biosynthesis C-methylase UbiE
VTAEQSHSETCILCGFSSNRLIFPSGVDQTTGLKKGIVKCAVCGLVFRTSRPTDEDIKKYYSEKTIDNVTNDWMSGRRNVVKTYTALFEPYRVTNRILDVGAGSGFFLFMMKQKGWECHGVEPSRSCAEFARKRFDLFLDADFFQTCSYENDFFDVVTFWNVLDHFPQPLQILDKAWKILRPGGLVVVRSPNASFHVPVKRLLKNIKNVPGWAGMADHSIIHLYSFNGRTISKALAATGFVQCEVKPARLSWTTAPGSKTGGVQKTITRIVDLSCSALYSFSSGRILISPSFLAMAVKPRPVNPPRELSGE